MLSSNKRHIIIILLLIPLLLNYGKLSAQSNPFFNVSYSDSVETEPGSSFVYNNVTITNTYSTPLTILTEIQNPQGWNLVNMVQDAIELKPGESYFIPLTYARTPQALAEWTPVSMNFRIQNKADVFAYKFYLIAKPRDRYISRINTREITLSAYQPEVSFKVFIKNTGNMVQKYNLDIRNRVLASGTNIPISLKPGEDTNYICTLKISKQQWQNLRTAETRVNIANQNWLTESYSIVIRKASSNYKAHESQYKTFPLSVFGGVANFGNQLSAYAGFDATFQINDYSNLNVMYTSPPIGAGATKLPPNFAITYNYKRLQIYTGIMGAVGAFTANGLGGRVTYRLKDEDFVSISGIKGSAKLVQGNSDLVSGTAHYSLFNKKIKIVNDVYADFDHDRHINSYICNNMFNIIRTKSLMVSLSGGVGMTHYKDSLIAKNDVIGYTGGYNVIFSKRNFQVGLMDIYTDDKYPGNLQGYNSANNFAKVLFKKSYLGVFYNYNHVLNIQRDTTFNSNIVIYNTKAYGLNTGWNHKRTSVDISTGIIDQTGFTGSLPSYNYVSLSYLYTKDRDNNLTINSFYGASDLTKKNNAYTGNQPYLWIERAVLNIKYGGLLLGYSQAPANTAINQLGSPSLINSDNAKIVETYNVSPFVRHKFMHDQLICQLQYNYMKSDITSFQNINSITTYSNRDKGFDVALGVYMPINSSGGLSANLSFRKNFDVPIITKKAYYNFKIVLFVDENANGKYDVGEQLIKNAEVNISGNSLLTDDSGSIQYINIEKGVYQMDFSNVRGLRGFVPKAGLRQILVINHDEVQFIAFKRSRYVYGTLDIHYAYNKKTVNLENFKVTAVDSDGNVFNTMTDGNGDYYLNLPANKYTISLNPEAFDDTYKPLEIKYSVDLIEHEEANVVFKIMQKRRELNVKQVELK
jgi:hypothetical protein